MAIVCQGADVARAGLDHGEREFVAGDLVVVPILVDLDVVGPCREGVHVTFPVDAREKVRTAVVIEFQFNLATVVQPHLGVAALS